MSFGNLALMLSSLFRFAGRRFVRSANDLQMVFLYDVNGFIAGMQSPVPVANTDDNKYFDYDASPAYNKDTIAGVEVKTFLTTKYFKFESCTHTYVWNSLKFFLLLLHFGPKLFVFLTSNLS
jgi:hypothetical protein